MSAATAIWTQATTTPSLDKIDCDRHDRFCSAVRSDLRLARSGQQSVAAAAVGGGQSAAGLSGAGVERGHDSLTLVDKDGVAEGDELRQHKKHEV